MPKFALLHDILLAEGLIEAADVVEPTEVPLDDLALFHTEAFIRKFATSSFDAAEVRRLGLPWTEPLIRRSRLAVTGTINACRFALEDGIGANLAGGTHHACPDHGEGFCVLNDVAIAVHVLRREGLAERFAIIDLDVHQGNGNAIAFGPEGGNDPACYTFSMHGAKNFPMRKPASDLDIGLPDKCGDEEYLQMLAAHLERVLDEARPELVMYLAGVDVVEGDRYGRLAMTRTGLFERDRYVVETVKGMGLPLTLLLAGGYARTPRETADLHAMSHRAARDVYGRVGASQVNERSTSARGRA
jgi:acetoin utilization deacetylase AcuC-like enzyme